ncbi:Dopamine D2-like receptor [Sarcoptes scabiei]|uniref:Dopamine D2-like receptor n=1 Tax=Sarcoptes scabiei TaxID=52283 RepID=A0A834RB04_SARSC|nr:Dopamine D2-like receptor [Sarcoptes scabiei]
MDGSKSNPFFNITLSFWTKPKNQSNEWIGEESRKNEMIHRENRNDENIVTHHHILHHHHHHQNKSKLLSGTNQNIIGPHRWYSSLASPPSSASTTSVSRSSSLSETSDTFASSSGSTLSVSPSSSTVSIPSSVSPSSPSSSSSSSTALKSTTSSVIETSRQHSKQNSIIFLFGRNNRTTENAVTNDADVSNAKTNAKYNVKNFSKINDKHHQQHQISLSDHNYVQHTKHQQRHQQQHRLIDAANRLNDYPMSNKTYTPTNRMTTAPTVPTTTPSSTLESTIGERTNLNNTNHRNVDHKWHHSYLKDDSISLNKMHPLNLKLKSSTKLINENDDDTIDHEKNLDAGISFDGSKRTNGTISTSSTSLFSTPSTLSNDIDRTIFDNQQNKFGRWYWSELNDETSSTSSSFSNDGTATATSTQKTTSFTMYGLQSVHNNHSSTNHHLYHHHHHHLHHHHHRDQDSFEINDDWRNRLSFRANLSDDIWNNRVSMINDCVNDTMTNMIADSSKIDDGCLMKTTTTSTISDATNNYANSINLTLKAVIEQLDSSTTLDEHERVYWALILIILPILALFGNFLVILSVYREKTLQTVTNWFIVSLAFADLFVTVPMLFSTYVMVNIDWELSELICDLYIATDVICSTASIFNLVAISFDRYIAVTHPIFYSKHKNDKRVIVTIILVWMASFGVGLPIMLGANRSPDRIPELCIFYNSNFIIYSSLWSFYVPCLIMVILYYKIFKAIHDRARKKMDYISSNASKNRSTIFSTSKMTATTAIAIGGTGTDSIVNANGQGCDCGNTDSNTAMISVNKQNMRPNKAKNILGISDTIDIDVMQTNSAFNSDKIITSIQSVQQQKISKNNSEQKNLSEDMQRSNRNNFTQNPSKQAKISIISENNLTNEKSSFEHNIDVDGEEEEEDDDDDDDDDDDEEYDDEDEDEKDDARAKSDEEKCKSIKIESLISPLKRSINYSMNQSVSSDDCSKTTINQINYSRSQETFKSNMDDCFNRQKYSQHSFLMRIASPKKFVPESLDRKNQSFENSKSNYSSSKYTNNNNVNKGDFVHNDDRNCDTRKVEFESKRTQRINPNNLISPWKKLSSAKTIVENDRKNRKNFSKNKINNSNQIIGDYDCDDDYDDDDDVANKDSKHPEDINHYHHRNQHNQKSESNRISLFSTTFDSSQMKANHSLMKNVKSNKKSESYNNNNNNIIILIIIAVTKAKRKFSLIKQIEIKLK